LDISEKLLELRVSSGKSQAEFAKLAGVSQRTWSSYESGQTTPKIGVLWALAARGFTIKGLTTSILRDMVDEGKYTEAEIQEYQKQITSNTKSLSHLNTNGLKIPLLKQKVSCGQGVNWETEENIEEYIEVDMLIPRLGIGRVFAVKAEGSSMLGAGIHAGDYIFFDGSEEQTPQDGIYVFVLDGDVYCKRLEFDKLSKKIKIFSVRFADLEKAELITSLDTNETEFADRFRIFGKVTRCIRLIDVEDR